MKLIKTDLLISDDFKALKAIESDIIEGFDRQQQFRSRFLMEVSVLNEMKHPTPDSKYAQCNLERDVHFRNLIMLSYDYREKKADIEILKLDKLEGPYADKQQVQIERSIAELHFMQKEAKERVREVTNWTEIMNILKPQLKYDPNTEDHQSEKYTIRYQREVEMMIEAGKMNAQDMNGAMNVLSLNKTVRDRR